MELTNLHFQRDWKTERFQQSFGLAETVVSIMFGVNVIGGAQLKEGNYKYAITNIDHPDKRYLVMSIQSDFTVII